MRETIIDGVNGILVPKRRPEALGRALSRMLEEPEWARTLGERARAYVVEKWNWERAVERVETCLAEVANGAKAGSRRLEFEGTP